MDFFVGFLMGVIFTLVAAIGGFLYVMKDFK